MQLIRLRRFEIQSFVDKSKIEKVSSPKSISSPRDQLKIAIRKQREKSSDELHEQVLNLQKSTKLVLNRIKEDFSEIGQLMDYKPNKMLMMNVLSRH